MAVKDAFVNPLHGLNVRAALAPLRKTFTDVRDKRLLSVDHETGLRASELVGVRVEDM